MYPEEINPDAFFFLKIISHKYSVFPDAASARQDIFCCSGRSGGSGLLDLLSVCSPSQDEPVTGGAWQLSGGCHRQAVFPQNQDR